ncbi:MAG: hypothetical protein PF572_04740 [Patescibacteria group bacterium]|jgi:tRNA-specific 2-thiouridylase|nr:hypothetical protein [Patescibacteria group bacterium]
MSKALVLMSGGLDSILAVKVLMEQGIEVTGLTFVSNFFDAAASKVLAKELGVELIDFDISSEHLEMVKNPKYGYGKNMNPCIDCHGLMVKKAYEIMKRGDFDFIATGEVLGQRPKSQNKQALGLVEKYDNIEGHLLRPLSAKLLTETKMEAEGLVDREKLLDIEGRNRERQIELTKKYGIKDYPSPGGGCILTYSEYSNKLRGMKDAWPNCTNNDVALLRAGRIFWFNDILVVVGRHKEDNDLLEILAKKDDLIFGLENVLGPMVILRDKNKEKYEKFAKIEVSIPKELETGVQLKTKDEIVKMAAIMTGYFVPKLRGKKVKVLVKS